MSKMKKPVREGYHTNYDYYADLLIYYLKTNVLLYVVVILSIVLIGGGILFYNYSISKKSKESTVLLEKVYDKLTLFIDHHSKMSNYEETKEGLIKDLSNISKKYFITTNGKKATYYLGLVYFIDKKYDKAYDNLYKLTKYKKFYLTPFAYYGSVVSLIKLNKEDDAIKLATKFYEKYKKTDFGAEASYILGVLYEKKGDFDNAIKYYKILEKDYSKSSILTNNFIKNSIYYTEAIHSKTNDIDNNSENKKKDK